MKPSESEFAASPRRGLTSDRGGGGGSRYSSPKASPYTSRSYAASNSGQIVLVFFYPWADVDGPNPVVNFLATTSNRVIAWWSRDSRYPKRRFSHVELLMPDGYSYSIRWGETVHRERRNYKKIDCYAFLAISITQIQQLALDTVLSTYCEKNIPFNYYGNMLNFIHPTEPTSVIDAAYLIDYEAESDRNHHTSSSILQLSDEVDDDNDVQSLGGQPRLFNRLTCTAVSQAITAPLWWAIGANNAHLQHQIADNVSATITTTTTSVDARQSLIVHSDEEALEHEGAPAERMGFDANPTYHPPQVEMTRPTVFCTEFVADVLLKADILTPAILGGTDPAFISPNSLWALIMDAMSRKDLQAMTVTYHQLFTRKT